MAGPRITPRASISNESGFTLIEVLVALIVLGLAIAVLFEIFGEGLARIHEAEQELAARTLARSLLEQVHAYGTPFGVQSGTAPRELSWTLRVTPYPQRDDKIANVHAAIVSATVSWPHGDGSRSLTLSTLQIHAKDEAP